MNGNTFTRIIRVLKNILGKPQNFLFYCKYSLTKKEPINFQLPWLSLDAIRFLKKYNINSTTKILELGGGGSTMFFANKGANVTCLESSLEWAEKLKKECENNNYKNVKILSCPYSLDSIEEFQNSEFYNNISSGCFDIILVDNYEEDIQFRPAAFYEAEKIISDGGIIIVDDSWRYKNLRVKNSAKKVKTFTSIGPCRPGVTSTDIYFY